MSKAIRIRDHLYAEIEALARTERRSLIAQLEVLLEQALQLPENFDKPKIAEATDAPREGTEVIAAPTAANPKRTLTVADDHFKPDFK